jgi:adenylate kinase family enzyme
MIIEFVGPPGAGKTTSCKSFTRLLRGRGLKIFQLQDLKDYVKQLKFHQKFYLVCKAIVFRSLPLIRYILILAANKIYSSNSIYRYVRLTIFDLALSEFQKSRQVDVFLLEQWIIQEMWSATIFKLKCYDHISKRLPQFYFHTDFVIYLDIDPSTASERISRRKSNRSRFDKMDTSIRINELIKYNNYLFQLYKNSRCTQKQLFSGYNSPEKNAAQFIKEFAALN